MNMGAVDFEGKSFNQDMGNQKLGGALFFLAIRP